MESKNSRFVKQFEVNNKIECEKTIEEQLEIIESYMKIHTEKRFVDLLNGYQINW